MIHEGVDVFRINFSHGTQKDKKEMIDIILELNEKLDTNVAILGDLQGPKLRVGKMDNEPVLLEEGKTFSLVTFKCAGTREQAYISYKQLPMDVAAGEIILIDDGKIALEVLETNYKDTVRTRVVTGGLLFSNKGLNLPNTNVSLPSLTEKDREDALFALDHHIDWLALSFVRSANDILDLKALISEHKNSAHVIAKIEKPEAIKDIDNIIGVSDGIMVARGDLGVEVEFHKVPLIQKQIISKCLLRSKPVIVATQMMESMIQNPTPTRAEANDVANAVLDGADTVMLSGETSVGKYPVETIRNMQKIIDTTESAGFNFYREHPPVEHNETFLADSVCYNAVVMAEHAGASAIITLSYSGYTALKVSSHRPRAPIFNFTLNKDLLRHLSLFWGVRSYYLAECYNVEEYIDYSIEFLLNKNYIKKGDLVVHVGSIPIIEKGKTNMIKLSHVT